MEDTWCYLRARLGREKITDILTRKEILGSSKTKYRTDTDTSDDGINLHHQTIQERKEIGESHMSPSNTSAKHRNKELFLLPHLIKTLLTNLMLLQVTSCT